MGDMVLTLSAIQNIRSEYEGANITLLTGSWNVDLFINSPIVDKVMVYNSPVYSRDKKTVTSPKERNKLFKKLKKNKIDLIIGFRDDIYSILFSLYIFPQMRFDRGTVRLKIKFEKVLSYLFNKSKEISQHEIETNKKIIFPLIKSYKSFGNYFKLSETELLWLKDFLKNNSVDEGKYAIIHPGASWKFKRWKADNFKIIGKFLFDNYDLKSIIIGTKDEYEIGEVIQNGNTDIFCNQIGKTSLRESIICNHSF